MRVRILGCSGGIGGGRHTTSMLIDDDCLIDAGSGVLRLGLDELARIDHVFLTHSHLDHIVELPFLADLVVTQKSTPLKIYGLSSTLDDLRRYVFNDRVWPDFSAINLIGHTYKTIQFIEIELDYPYRGPVDKLMCGSLYECIGQAAMHCLLA